MLDNECDAKMCTNIRERMREQEGCKDGRGRERERDEERERRAIMQLSTTLALPSSSRVSVFRVASPELRQSREPTFAIRCRDVSVCEEPGSRNKIDVEKEKRWSR